MVSNQCTERNNYSFLAFVCCSLYEIVVRILSPYRLSKFAGFVFQYAVISVPALLALDDKRVVQNIFNGSGTRICVGRNYRLSLAQERNIITT